jgi:hypothetical protein
MTTLDPRMELTLSGDASAKPVNAYRVHARDQIVLAGTCRHSALQVYVAMRKHLNDFGPAESRLVKIFCNNVEYLNEDESWPPGPKDRGKSCRQITGAVRPYPWERHMP